MGWSVGHWWKLGRTGRHETFSTASVPGQKPYAILRSERPAFRPFSSDALAWPQSILFGQSGLIILRGRGRSESCDGIAIVPGHPLRRDSLQLSCMALQLDEIVKWIDAVQLAGVNQAHEQISHPRSIPGLVENLS